MLIYCIRRHLSISKLLLSMFGNAKSFDAVWEQMKTNIACYKNVHCILGDQKN